MTTLPTTPGPAPIRRHRKLAARLGSLLPASGQALAGSAAVLITLGAGLGVLSTSAASAATLAASGQTNCIAQPSACGYPDATNTGVPAGMTLTNVPAQKTSGPGWYWDSRGWLEVTGTGAVLSGLNIAGNLDVSASNVTITDDQISNTGANSMGISLRHTSNVTISHDTITGANTGSGRMLVGVKDVYGDTVNTVIEDNNISMVETGVQISEGLIQGNYIHNMGYVAGDHTNGITSNGGTTPLTIQGNTVLDQLGQTDAIGLFEDFGVQANRTITGNLLAGGAYSIYGGQNQGGPATSNIQITNNRVSNIYFTTGGSWGPLTAWNATGTGDVFSGNIWDATGQPIS